MKAQPIPRSQATTAYDLLSDVVAVVLAEPKRLRMAVPLWLDVRKLLDDAPACGTVGCVAGWTVMLKDRPSNVDFSVCERAGDILGLTERQQMELFYTFPKAAGGTTRHAKEEVRLIRKFQKKYARQLKAKAV
jgi:hypothetical protein